MSERSIVEGPPAANFNNTVQWPRIPVLDDGVSPLLADVARQFGDLFIRMHEASGKLSESTSFPIPAFFKHISGPVPSKPLLRIGNILTRFADKIDAKKRSTPHITGSLIIFWNPKANGGNATKVASSFLHTLSEMQKSGELKIEREVIIKSTNGNPQARIDEISFEIETLLQKYHGERIAVIGIGGDRTADDVANAVSKVYQAHADDETKPNIVAVAGPGGTANDLKRIMGVPSDVREFIKFLGNGVITLWHGINLELLTNNDERESRTTFYGTTWGISGEFSRLVEKKKKENGGVSVFETLFMLPYVFLNPKPIHAYVEVNGEAVNDGEEIVAGEIFGPLVTHSLGMVARLPMPIEGARIFFAPTLPVGVIPLFESFVRGFLLLMGFQRFINPDGHVLTLSGKRHLDIKPGDVVTMKISDDKSQAVAGTIAGDSHEPVKEVKIAGLADPVPFLTSCRADIRVHRGLAYPSLPGDGLTNGAISQTIHGSMNYANTMYSIAHQEMMFMATLPPTFVNCMTPAALIY